jgi:PhoH-like ATPase
MLDDLRVSTAGSTRRCPVGDEGGTLRVELNHSDPSVLPAGFRLGHNDSRILAVALNLRAEGARRHAGHQGPAAAGQGAAVGLDADEYRARDAVDAGWTGMAELEVDDAELDELYDDGVARRRGAASCPATPGWCCSPRAARRWAG